MLVYHQVHEPEQCSLSEIFLPQTDLGNDKRVSQLDGEPLLVGYFPLVQ